MVDVTIGGEVRPLHRYTLKRLRAVAPQIDALRAANREIVAKLDAAATSEEKAKLLSDLTMASTLDQMADYVRVIAVGIPEKTPDPADLDAQASDLEEQVTMEEARALNAAFIAILQEAGLAAKPGEAGPGSTSEPQSQSPAP